jgi:YidC/Oxa1 family membrane protein insertase
MLLQMPIFIALFTVLRNIGDYITTSTTFTFYNIIPDLTVGPAQVIAASGIPAAAVYIFLDLLFGGLTLIPLLLNSQTNADPQQQRTSRIMGIVMAVWMVWIGWSLPSGVLLYYNTSALWQVASSSSSPSA